MSSRATIRFMVLAGNNPIDFVCAAVMPGPEPGASENDATSTNSERAFISRPAVYEAWGQLNGAIKAQMDLRGDELALSGAPGGDYLSRWIVDCRGAWPQQAELAGVRDAVPEWAGSAYGS